MVRFNVRLTLLDDDGIMLISHSSLINASTLSRSRIHVLPDKKDRIFNSSQKDQFETSSRNYLEAFDQVGETGARRGAVRGALTCSVFGGAIVAGATALCSGSWSGLIKGALLGGGIACTLAAIVYPAAVSHGGAEAQDSFVKAHSAPYLEVGPEKWLTADKFLISDINHQTRGRLPV